MHKLLLLLTAFVAFSGCLSSDDSDDHDDDHGGMGGDHHSDVPATIHHEGSGIGLGALDVDMQEVDCVLGDLGCDSYTFSIDAEWHVTIYLNQTVGPLTGTTGVGDPAGLTHPTDYDLFLLDSDGAVLASSTNPGGEDDMVEEKLKAGDYTVTVEAWHDLDGSYSLDIVFDHP